MSAQAQMRQFECPTEELAAYIDGELSPALELELEAHLAKCNTCSLELNQQKQFLCGLSSSLKNEGDLELPANFTRLIVANAESTVSGLRRPRERFNAIFICAGLCLFVLFALGADAGKIFEFVSGLFVQIAAVGGFLGRVVYSVFIGVAIVLRSVATRISIDAVMAIALTAIAAATLTYLSRKVLRIHRA